MYWRPDFDIETAANNLVEEFNDPILVGNSNWHEKVYEIRRPTDAGHKRKWKISNTGTGSAYELVPGQDGKSDAYGVGDLWVLRYHPNEIEDAQGFTTNAALVPGAHRQFQEPGGACRESGRGHLVCRAFPARRIARGRTAAYRWTGHPPGGLVLRPIRIERGEWTDSPLFVLLFGQSACTLPTINSLDRCHHFSWIDTRETKRYHRSASSSTDRPGRWGYCGVWSWGSP